MQTFIKSIHDKHQIQTLLNRQNERDILKEKDNHGDTLLHFACRIHCLDVIKLLIAHGADPEAVNEHGRRPIHEAIESIECVSYLVNTCHIDVNAMKRGDWTPVMSAALKGNLDTVKILVDGGALLNRTTRDGRTALYLAVQEGHIQLSKYLTDAYPGAITQATKSGRLPTQAAAALEDTTSAYIITRYLLSHTSDETKVLAHRDNSGRNILLDAAVAQNIQLLQFLLDTAGADPNDSDSLGRNMIHHAAMMGHSHLLQLLSGFKVDWNSPDAWDAWTPLMHAARQGHLHVVKYLVDVIHVSVDCKDKQGRTALDIARLWKHTLVEEYLLEKVG